MEKIAIFILKHFALVGKAIPGTGKFHLINVLQDDFTDDKKVERLKEQYEAFYDEVEIRDERDKIKIKKGQENNKT